LEAFSMRSAERHIVEANNRMNFFLITPLAIVERRKGLGNGGADLATVHRRITAARGGGASLGVTSRAP
jgi:hypothetical protein